jgi:signal transduction histidine kinase
VELSGPPPDADSLADPSTRPQAAAAIAQRWGAQAFLILVPDPELGQLRPAPGFPSTLPGGPTWRDLLQRSREPGTFAMDVDYPTRGCRTHAEICVAADGTAFVLVGIRGPCPGLQALAHAPLLSALLRNEMRVQVAQGSLRATREATERALELTDALEKVRIELQAKANALREALKEADRLNEELAALNESLEQRVSSEIAERLKAEESLRQAQKMEAIGQLTGGVAHDFNNLLTVVIGSLESQQRQLEALEPTPAIERISRLRDMAATGAERAALLTARLLAFARRQPLNPTAVDIGQLIDGLTPFLRRAVGERIAIHAAAGAPSLLVEVDVAQLETAILNLAINARDAMPDGGSLDIAASSVDSSEVRASVDSAPPAPGRWVLIAISDSGVGMDEATLERAFEPFFTTKGIGKGTGLGLSQVYGFVRQSGGHTHIESAPGRGTTIRIYLPVSGAAVPDAKAASDNAPGLATGGREDLLVYSRGALQGARVPRPCRLRRRICVGDPACARRHRPAVFRRGTTWRDEWKGIGRSGTRVASRHCRPAHQRIQP